MTEDRPATSPDEPRQLEAFLSFADQVANLPGPRNWVIAAVNETDPHAAEPHVTAVLPMPRGVTVEQWLARHGAVPGTYLARLEPIAGSPNAKRSKLDRLQARGSVTAQLRVTAADVAAAERIEAANATAKAGAAAPAPRREEASIVRRKREEVELQRAENERLAAELDHRRLQRELQKLDAGDTPPAAAGGSLAGVLAAVAPLLPVVKDIIGGWMATQREQFEALRALAERAPETVTVAAPSASPLSLASLLDLLPQVKELGKLLANFGGGRAASDDDDEPQSETLQMLGMVRDLVSQFGGAAPSVAGADPVAVAAPLAPAPAPARSPRRELSPQDQMNLRVLQFFAIVQREQSLTADPEAVAERLFPQIGTLPAAFRQLLFTAASASDLLTALPQWLPPGSMRTEVPNAIRQSPERMAWLATFLETVQDIAKGGDDDGEPVGDDDDDARPPFDGNDGGG